MKAMIKNELIIWEATLDHFARKLRTCRPSEEDQIRDLITYSRIILHNVQSFYQVLQSGDPETINIKGDSDE